MSDTLDDHQAEDLAADLRDHGHTWAAIAAAVNLTPYAAQQAANRADTRAAERAARNQITLF
ncbi:hypothetical protein GTV32_22845 [Gordonia sp. SID5947]|uniref:hypothetical protein n=1 Tax=Gordonia sp. SID5947 TaxID=2690315 RepID=UPI0013705BD9|nr:hypothetical protein [Gordonia sp. SID5947]MYR08974.1 hypothetical protein [Gordonia sp. SID5947]